MPLIEDAQRHAALLKEHAYVRILARDDADAYCATALLAHALRRHDIDFHASFTPRLDEARLSRIAEDADACLILVGLDGNATIRLDRANDASLSATAQMVAVALQPKNADLAPLAIAGAIAARSAASLDAKILQDAAASGVVRNDVTLNLHGSGLLTALSQMDEPFLPGITGRARNAKKLLTDLSIGSDIPPESLSTEDAQRLGDALALRLLHARASDRALDALFRPRVRTLKGPHTGQDAFDLARLAQAAAAGGRGGLAFAGLWGDEAAQRELGDVVLALREEIVASLLKAEREIRREGALSIADAPRSGACSLFADRLALSLAPHGVAVARAAEDEFVTLAASGKSVDLVRAASMVGGHAASGVARVPVAEESRFLKLLAEGIA